MFIRDKFKGIKSSLSGMLFFRAVGDFFQHIFIFLFVVYFLLLLAEMIWEETVTNAFNPNYILLAVIVVGIPALLMAKRKKNVENEIGRIKIGDIVMMVFTSIGGSVLVWYKTKDIGWPSVVIPVISFVLIVLLSLLLLKGGDERKTRRLR